MNTLAIYNSFSYYTIIYIFLCNFAQHTQIYSTTNSTTTATLTQYVNKEIIKSIISLK